MSSYIRATWVVGILIPLLAIGLIGGSSAVVGWRLLKRAKAQRHHFSLLQTQRQRITQLEQDKATLSAELPPIQSYSSNVRMEEFLLKIQSSSSEDPGLRVIRSDAVMRGDFFGHNPEAAALQIEGLSTPMLSIMGEAFKESPALFADTWTLRPNAERDRLLVSMTVVLSKRTKGNEKP